MAQNIDWLGNQYNNVPYIQLPKVGGGTAQFTDASITTAVEADVASGKKFLKADGSEATGTASGGSGKNVQYVMDSKSVRTNGYTDTGISLTVAKTGTYKVSWVGWRSSSQGTMGSRLRINDSDQTAQTTFTNTYGQHVVMNNVSLRQGDVLHLYATAGSTTRYMWVANLIIEEQ